MKYRFLLKSVLIKKKNVREHRQKTFVLLNGFWPLNGWGESVKKRKIRDEIFFFQMLYEALKISEK